PFPVETLMVGPGPAPLRWTSSSSPSIRTWSRSPPCWLRRAIGSRGRSCNGGRDLTRGHLWAAASWTRFGTASPRTPSTSSSSTANAGKTSLLNALADERLLVEDRMFSTLSTATRSLTGTRKRILLTDTIGFVDGVPFWMAEAFQATLEEILHADLVLLLVDATDP